MNKNQIFIEVFRQFGDSWYLSDDITSLGTLYLCLIWLPKREIDKRSENEAVQKEIYEKWQSYQYGFTAPL